MIHNDTELDRLTEVLLELDEIDRPSREQQELAELLTVLIEHYEKEHFSLRDAHPHEVIRLLLEQKGLGARDLWGVLGSKGTTSNILNGKRKIGPAVAARLGAFFDMAPELFIEWDDT